jgi:hypothetical protein
MMRRRPRREGRGRAGFARPTAPGGIARRLFRRAVALGVIAATVQTGCATRSSIHYAQRERDLHQRTDQISTIALVTVDVTVIREELLSSHFSREWVAIARGNLRRALIQHFGTDPRFALSEFDPKGREEARQELTDVRRVMDALLPSNAIPLVGVDCLPGPTLALADAAGTDTLLLAYATGHIKPASTRAAIVGFGGLAVPLIVAAMVGRAVGLYPPPPRGDNSHPLSPLATRDAITLCLVDARKGEVLWFDTQFVGTMDLLDASDVDALIGAAYDKFKEARSQ